MNPPQRQAIEDRENLALDLFRRIAIARGRNVRRAAPQEIGAIDAAALGDGWSPTVPERRVARKTVHHQHWRRLVPRPQIIVDGTMQGNAIGKADRRHQGSPSVSWPSICAAISARPALATVRAGPSGPSDWPME